MSVKTKINIRLQGLSKRQQDGVKELEKELEFEQSDQGFPVVVRKNESGLRIGFGREQAVLSYEREVEFYRGLGLVIEQLAEKKHPETIEDVEEHACFNDLSYMLDNSRNAVVNLRTLKKQIRQMVLMGFHSLLLYTEDTYEIPGEPFWGYMRGRFTGEELKELDQYGRMFGIELVPCIQTLAHLNQIFKWDAYQEVRDIGDILLCGEGKTYELLEKMIKTCSECFSSRKINIGMDEAELTGRGKYLNRNGYLPVREIMMTHLNKVMEICHKYGFAPMMWSDMFFKMLNNGGYHEEDLTGIDKVREKIPEDLELIYWDYYSRSKEKYHRMLEKHELLTDHIGFAGGAWKWNGFAPLCVHSAYASREALPCCKEHGIKHVLVTAWGDNGAECSSFVTMPVLQIYAEFCYKGYVEPDEVISRRLQTCCHMKLEDFRWLDSLNLTPDNPSPGRVSVGPQKYLFYQDILLGLYDRHVDAATYPAHFRQCAQHLAEAGKRAGEYAYIFENLEALSRVLEMKCTIGIELKKAYDEKDREKLLELKERLGTLLSRIEVFHTKLSDQWYRENKPFGMDVLDLRIGGLKERVRRAEWTIDQYLQNNIDSIPELEVERFVLDERENPGYQTLPIGHNNWGQMVSANVL